MTNCHCARMIYGFWEAQMTPPIKLKLAGQKFNATTYTDLFKLADEAWLANGGSVNTPAVVAAVSDTTSSTPEPTAQVGAVNRGQGRGRGRGGRNNRGGRGNNRGANNSSTYNQNQNTNQDQSSSNNKSHQKGPKHPDLPSSASWACAQHWKKGRSAPYCSDPLVCKWVSIVAPRTPVST